jgi:hypothetical protein
MAGPVPRMRCEGEAVVSVKWGAAVREPGVRHPGPEAEVLSHYSRSQLPDRCPEAER